MLNATNCFTLVSDFLSGVSFTSGMCNLNTPPGFASETYPYLKRGYSAKLKLFVPIKVQIEKNKDYLTNYRLNNCFAYIVFV